MNNIKEIIKYRIMISHFFLSKDKSVDIKTKVFAKIFFFF